MSALETIVCRHEDKNLTGLLALPPGPGPHPGVLVAHNAHGIGDHMRAVIGYLAAQGYAALALDMYGDAAYSEDEEEIGRLVAPLWGNSQRLRARMGAWLDVLRARSEVDGARVAAIGYCFGGMCVLELARGGADLRAVVSYHGILTTDARAEPGAIEAHVAVYTGGRDPHVPPADVDALRGELRAAGADWQITEFANAFHAFTDPAANAPERGRAFDPLANRLSWAGTLALFEERLRG